MIKLNAGFTRKVGEANYSSRGASVNLELELESTLVSDPEKMHEKIRALFVLARKAVDEELKNGNGSTPQKADSTPDKDKTSADPVCAECGTDRISDKVIKFSTDKFGKVLCYHCQKALNGNEGR